MPSVYLAPSFCHIVTAAFGFTILILNRLSVECWRVFNGLQWYKVAGGEMLYISFQLGFYCMLGFSCKGTDVILIPFDLGFPFFINQCKNFKSLAFLNFFITWTWRPCMPSFLAKILHFSSPEQAILWQSSHRSSWVPSHCQCALSMSKNAF